MSRTRDVTISQGAQRVRCPHCGTLHDAFTALSEGRKAVRPTPGALTLCIACRGWCAFTIDLLLRAATDDEIADLNPLLRRIIEEGAPPPARHRH